MNCLCNNAPMIFASQWFRSRQRRPTSTRATKTGTSYTTPLDTLLEEYKTDQLYPSDKAVSKDLPALQWTIDTIDYEHTMPSRGNVRDIPRTIYSGKQVETELQDRFDAIVALRNLVLRQRDKIHSLRNKLRDYKERLVKVKGRKNRDARGSAPLRGVLGHPNEIFRKRTVSFSPSVARTDNEALSEDILQEHLSSAETKGIDNDVKETIFSIHCQASKLDDVITLDEILSLKIELKTTTKALEAKDAVIDDLKREIREKDKRIGTLEIERDLIEADAMEAKEFPKNRIPDSRHTSLVAAPPISEECIQGEKSPKQKDDHISTTIVTPSSKQKIISSLKVRLHNIISPSSKSKSPKSRGRTSGLDKRNGPVAQHGEMNSCRIDFATQNDHELAKGGPAIVTVEDSTPAKLRSLLNPALRNSHQAQSDKLNEQLQVSRQESEQLREHLMHIKCCYDDKIRSLQTDMAQLKQEKLRAESQMNHMVYAVVEEKQQAIKRMQTKMRLKDSLISQLQKSCSTDIHRIECES